MLTLVRGIFLSLFFTIFLCAFSFAQTPTPVPTVGKEVELQAKTALKTSECACAAPLVEALKKTYQSDEEDEWTVAIKIGKDTVTKINALAKTCKCPEIQIYQKVAEAFLKYAEAGNYLDGTEEPDCDFALKSYDKIIALLEESILKIPDVTLKENAKSIQSYAREEHAFVKDECQESEGTKPKQKSSSDTKQ